MRRRVNETLDEYNARLRAYYSANRERINTRRRDHYVVKPDRDNANARWREWKSRQRGTR